MRFRRSDCSGSVDGGECEIISHGLQIHSPNPDTHRRQSARLRRELSGLCYVLYCRLKLIGTQSIAFRAQSLESETEVNVVAERADGLGVHMLKDLLALRRLDGHSSPQESRKKE